MPPTSFDIGFSLNPCPRKLGAPHDLAVGKLIEAVPKKTSEYFRYGFLLNEAYGNVVIRTDGDVDVDGRNITHALFRLCTLLKAFVQEEAW